MAVQKGLDPRLLPALQGLVFEPAVPGVLPVQAQHGRFRQVAVIDDGDTFMVGDKTNGSGGFSAGFKWRNKSDFPGLGLERIHQFDVDLGNVRCTMGPGEVDPVGRCGRCGKKYRQRDKPQMKGRFFHRQVSIRDQTLIIDYVCR
jgi:hypothetical protein